MHITEVDQFTLQHIVSYLDIFSVIRLLSTCQHFRQFRSNPLISSHIGIVEDCIKQKDWNKGLLFAVSTNQILLVEYFLRKSTDCWIKAVETASEQGYKQIAECLLHHIPQFSHSGGVAETESQKHFWIRIGMCGAAKGGHPDLVQYFAEQITEEDKRAEHAERTAFLWAVYGAAINGHQDIIEYLEQHESTESKRDYFKDIGLYAATQGNQKDLIEKFTSQGGKINVGELLVNRDSFALGPMPTVLIAHTLPGRMPTRNPLVIASRVINKLFGN